MELRAQIHLTKREKRLLGLLSQHLLTDLESYLDDDDAGQRKYGRDLMAAMCIVDGLLDLADCVTKCPGPKVEA